MDNVGLKYDDGKLRWDLLDLETIEQIVKILTFGSEKYGENTWQKLENAKERYYAALMRHLVEYRKNIKSDKISIDDESGLLHISHAFWNIMALTFFELQKLKKEIYNDPGKSNN